MSYDSAPSTPQHRDVSVRTAVSQARVERGNSVDADSSLRAESVEGLTVYDEVQMMRRQIAKLNHRLMAVELENQQQQQREMVRLIHVVTLYSLLCPGVDRGGVGILRGEGSLVDQQVHVIGSHSSHLPN